MRQKVGEMMAKEALLDHSSGIVRLFLDGEFLKGVISIDDISNIYQKDTAKDISTIIALLRALQILIKQSPADKWFQSLP